LDWAGCPDGCPLLGVVDGALLAGCDLLAHPTTPTAITAANTTANNDNNTAFLFDT
jgi:hypothetical protein